MRVAIGAPGNGAALKDEIKVFLEEDGRVSEVLDLSSPDITYPAVSFRAAQAVVDGEVDRGILACGTGVGTAIAASKVRSEEHTSELQSLMRISYAVFCLKKKKTN